VSPDRRPFENWFSSASIANLPQMIRRDWVMSDHHGDDSPLLADEPLARQYRMVEARHAEALAEAWSGRDGIGGLVAEVEYYLNLQVLQRQGLPVIEKIVRQAPHADRARWILFQLESDLRELRETWVDDKGRRRVGR
jgi:hypothetical protein